MTAAQPTIDHLFRPLSLGTIGLGCIGLLVQDFALQWQPVPAQLPGYALLALLCACLVVVLGALLWFRPARLGAASALAAYFTVWTLALMVPPVLKAPGEVVAWLGLAEIAALGAGAAAVAAAETGSRSALLAARTLGGACALVFGLSHFVYADFTAGMVPPWLPMPLAWAYVTGAGHIAAGLALLSGIRARLAAFALSAMSGAFVLLVHLPRVIAEPSSRAEWTALFVALSIAGAVLALAAAPQTHFRAVFGRAGPQPRKGQPDEQP